MTEFELAQSNWNLCLLVLSPLSVFYTLLFFEKTELMCRLAIF